MAKALTHCINPWPHAGIYEEFINSSEALVTYRTYAHSYYNRLLLTEVHIQRQQGVTGAITVTRASLAGEDSTDFTWGAEQDYNVTYK